MAFVSLLWDGTVEEAVFSQGESFLSEAWIGYDPNAAMKYNLHVNIQVREDGTEFAFCLLKTSMITGDALPVWDSAEAGKIIPKSCRAQVLSTLLRVSERLIRLSDRDEFYMVTFVDNLPPAALVKYDLLCDIFKRCGYVCTHSEPKQGTHFWRMNR